MQDDVSTESERRTVVYIYKKSPGARGQSVLCLSPENKGYVSIKVCMQCPYGGEENIERIRRMGDGRLGLVRCGRP